MKIFDAFVKAAVITCIAVLLIVFGYSAYNYIQKTESTGERASYELSSLRMNVYIASADISSGDEITTEGENANVVLTEIYSSLDEALYFDGSSGYALRDIAEGEPLYTSAVGEEEPEEKETEVLISYEPSYSFPFVIKAVFEDEEGEKLADSSAIQMEEGVTELDLSACAAKIEGYELSQILIGEDAVLSVGISEVQELSGTELVYYYITQEGLRTELTEAAEILFIYIPEEE